MAFGLHPKAYPSGPGPGRGSLCRGGAHPARAAAKGGALGGAHRAHRKA
ncbi:hypothetical protein Q0M07_14235 [Staphylococcus aureus]|nr:hypothetical protein [Staphylococcus aureus]